MLLKKKQVLYQQEIDRLMINQPISHIPNDITCNEKKYHFTPKPLIQ